MGGFDTDRLVGAHFDAPAQQGESGFPPLKIGRRINRQHHGQTTTEAIAAGTLLTPPALADEVPLAWKTEMGSAPVPQPFCDTLLDCFI